MSKLSEPIIGAMATDWPLPKGAHSDGAEIEDLFETVLDRHSSSEFIENLYDWWTNKGFLTEAQYEKLVQMAKEPDFGRWR